MTALFPPQTLFPLPLFPRLRNPSPRTGTGPRRKPLTLTGSKEVERGVEFETGDSFFRRESAVGRDLGVLAAVLHRKSLGRGLRVLDAMCGCGVRSLRYLSQAGASFVWANDAFEGYRGLILSNLSGEARVSPGGDRRWVVTHLVANKVLADRYLQRDFFDLVDIDSFGSDSSFMRLAIAAVKIGGLLYITSTDGYSSGGHRPHHSLDSYGAYVRPMPYSNEIGLRMLIGGAYREAAASGFHLSPLFSYYSYHGPIFRVMLQVARGKLHENSQYSFISYCNQCGNSETFPWEELGQISCPCRNGGVLFLKTKQQLEVFRGLEIETLYAIMNDEIYICQYITKKMVSRSVVVSGPLWTGPLHDAAYLTEMLKLAREWGWACTKQKDVDLEKLLNQMIDESDPQLPPGYIKLDEIARRAKINSPPISTLISTLEKEGYVASRSHIVPNAVKTNCPMADCIHIARELRHVR
ncbi:tRNA (guanine(26)-N(2))-dimethyltransferase isoform X1 [Phoenix dactylifera]|uniref:tRNA (guanine(26)-N(2))-dimethyltransferase n=1 Tax=Phoenix dactylifera TaxID=42345 RepID=A0A8B7CX80_PHODC|nr:tRNA (guanine(26)-N(2))-dimethyltransferase isoform X1 [Phoenix dactylifera]